MQKPELLSPAGDFECLNSAVSFGADAVFLAGKEFGMRTASANFDNEQLKKACEYAHNNNVKVHLTCNTLPRTYEVERLPAFLEFAEDAGVDAFIVADVEVMDLCKKYAPSVALHVSTQAGVTNHLTANTLYNMGAERVVLARELSLEEITSLRAKTPKELEIECFVHGAMCVSFSGRCLISSYMTGRDANRGDCAQPCRWKYHLFEENREGQFFPVEENDKGTFLYNSRDLCMIEHIPELVKAGISSFKIEGRAKSSYYVAVVTNAYRHAIDEYFNNPEGFILPDWIKEETEKISHREYNTGFYFGHEPGQVTGNGGYIRHYDVVAFCEKNNGFSCEITQRNKFYTGDTLDVLPPGGVPFNTVCQKLVNENGDEVESAPHAKERLFMMTDKEVPEGSVIRVKRKD
ncbi:MAG: U32 family peptidase [Ruminococcus sp.]|nr:U32 family peptidase [Ruminococcus sp.]